MKQAKRTKQINQSTGVVLDRISSNFLCVVGARDGVVKSDLDLWKDFIGEATAVSESFIRDQANDLLSSILIYGESHLLLADGFLDFLDISKFQEEGISLLVHSPYEEKQIDKLHRIYDKVYSCARFLEGHDYLSPIVSYDTPLPSKEEFSDNSVEIETQSSDYEYYLDLFEREMSWVGNLSPELFQLFLVNQHLWKQQFQDSYEQYFSPDKNSELQNNLSIDGIMELMDLHLRDIQEIDLMSYSAEAVLSAFPPNYFREFKNIDSQWGEVDVQGDFSDFMEKSLFARSFDQEQFSTVHSFWKTYFETRRLISLSSELGVQIKLPQNISLRSSYPLSHDEERLQLYRLYVRNVNSIPKIENTNDLFRLFNHKYMARFRMQLDEWRQALHEGDTSALQKMQHDFELATKDLATVATMQKVGDILTVVSLPVGIAGLLMGGLPLDFAFTAIGPALLGYSKLKEKRASWVKFGSLG